MGMTFEQMHRKMLRMLGIDVAVDEDDENLSVDDRKLFLNTSWWEIADKFPFREKEASASFVTVAGTRNYDVPTETDAIRNISGRTNLEQHFDIAPMDVEEYENNYNENSNYRAIPTRYTRENCMIRLWPTPDDAYTMFVRYWKQLPDMLAGIDQPDAPRNWHEIVLYGAVWRGFLELGDISRANGFTNYQHKLINSAVPVEQKEQQDFRFAGVQLIRNEYDRFVDPNDIAGHVRHSRRNFDTT